VPRLRLWAVRLISATLVLATPIIGVLTMREIIIHNNWYYYPMFFIVALGFIALAALVSRLETTSAAPIGVVVVAGFMLAGNTYIISYKVLNGLGLLGVVLSGVFAALSYILVIPLMYMFPDSLVPRLRLWAVRLISATLVLATFITGAFTLNEIVHGRWYYYPMFFIAALGFIALAALVSRLETTSEAPIGVVAVAGFMLAGNTFMTSYNVFFSGLGLLGVVLSGVFAVLSYILVIPLMYIFPTSHFEDDRFVYDEDEEWYDVWWTLDKEAHSAVDNPFTSSMRFSPYSYYSYWERMQEMRDIMMDFAIREFYSEFNRFDR